MPIQMVDSYKWINIAHLSVICNNIKIIIGLLYRSEFQYQYIHNRKQSVTYCYSKQNLLYADVSIYAVKKQKTKQKRNSSNMLCLSVRPLRASISSCALPSSFILVLYNLLTLECTPMPLTSLSPCTQATLWAYAVPMGGRRKVEQDVRMRYSQ